MSTDDPIAIVTVPTRRHDAPSVDSYPEITLPVREILTDAGATVIVEPVTLVIVPPVADRY